MISAASSQARSKVAFVHGVAVGAGGLGVQSGNAVCGLASGPFETNAYGPGHVDGWPHASPSGVSWHLRPRAIPPWARYTWLRWYTGQLQYLHDRALGRWAQQEIQRDPPKLCYAFTQVGPEALRWAQ